MPRIHSLLSAFALYGVAAQTQCNATVNTSYATTECPTLPDGTQCNMTCSNGYAVRGRLVCDLRWGEYFDAELSRNGFCKPVQNFTYEKKTNLSNCEAHPGCSSVYSWSSCLAGANLFLQGKNSGSTNQTTFNSSPAGCSIGSIFTYQNSYPESSYACGSGASTSSLACICQCGTTSQCPPITAGGITALVTGCPVGNTSATCQPTCEMGYEAKSLTCMANNGLPTWKDVNNNTAACTKIVGYCPALTGTDFATPCAADVVDSMCNGTCVAGKERMPAKCMTKNGTHGWWKDVQGATNLVCNTSTWYHYRKITSGPNCEATIGCSSMENETACRYANAFFLDSYGSQSLNVRTTYPYTAPRGCGIGGTSYPWLYSYLGKVDSRHNGTYDYNCSSGTSTSNIACICLCNRTTDAPTTMAPTKSLAPTRAPTSRAPTTGAPTKVRPTPVPPPPTVAANFSGARPVQPMQLTLVACTLLILSAFKALF